MMPLLIALTLVAAEIPTPRGYVCVQARSPVTIDGRLDEEAWKDAPWTEDFRDIEGGTKPLPRLRTRARMLWDDQFFYIAAELSEPHVWGKITDHDAVIFQDNDFEIFLDPDGDNHEYGEIEINAHNAEWDLRLVKPYRDGGPALNSWEIPGLKTAVHLDGTLNDPSDIDTSWSVELAIPWKALAEHAHTSCPPHDRDQWRVNFSRVEWDHRVVGQSYEKIPNRPENNWVWSPQGVIDMHQPEHWGYVQFSTAPPGQEPFHPDPSAPARDRLMKIYHAQKSFYKRSGRWAATLADLGLEELADPPGAGHPTLHLVDPGFEASIQSLPSAAQAARTWTVRQDSRLSWKKVAD